MERTSVPGSRSCEKPGKKHRKPGIKAKAVVLIIIVNTIYSFID
jgi:hypothetical protein